MAIGRVGLASLLRQPAARLLWLSQVGSAAGDRLYGVGLIWITLQVTGTPGAVAAVMIADTLPLLAVSVFSGAIVDRGNPLRLARLVDVARAAVVVVIPIAYLRGELSLTILLFTAGMLSSLEAFFLPALQSSLPDLVDGPALTGMISLLDTTDRLGRILGPGLVGVLAAAVSDVHLMTVDALTFLLSAAALTMLLRRKGPGDRRTAASEADADADAVSVRSRRALTGGWRAIYQRPVLRDAIVLRGLCNLAWPVFTVAVPFAIAHRYQHSIAGYGLVLAAFGAGNLLGNVASAGIVAHPARWCALAWTASGIGFLALAASQTYWLFAALAGAVGICTPIANVTIDAYIATTIPPRLLARVYTAQRLLVVAASTMGLPAAAVLTTHGGAQLALATGGTCMATIGALALLRQLRQRTPPANGNERALATEP